MRGVGVCHGLELDSRPLLPYVKLKVTILEFAYGALPRPLTAAQGICPWTPLWAPLQTL